LKFLKGTCVTMATLAPRAPIAATRGASVTADATATTPATNSGTAARYVFGGVRIALGWVFLWAFLDKLFGLGHETLAKNAWIDGGSPTSGFLGKAAAGPFKGLYNGMAGAAAADWLFMAALLGIGVALILGIGMRAAAIAGALLLVMMWTAVLPPANNPFMDDHLIYAGTLIGLTLIGAGNTLGLGTWWSATALVRKAPWLR
jgi:thiosulfate dehydrogenase (quinone) large subunit